MLEIMKFIGAIGLAFVALGIYWLIGDLILGLGLPLLLALLIIFPLLAGLILVELKFFTADI